MDRMTGEGKGMLPVEILQMWSLDHSHQNQQDCLAACGFPDYTPDLLNQTLRRQGMGGPAVSRFSRWFVLGEV